MALGRCPVSIFCSRETPPESVMWCYVTISAPHTVLKSIAWGKLTLDEMVVIHYVGTLKSRSPIWFISSGCKQTCSVLKCDQSSEGKCRRAMRETETERETQTQTRTEGETVTESETETERDACWGSRSPERQREADPQNAEPRNSEPNRLLRSGSSRS